MNAVQRDLAGPAKAERTQRAALERRHRRHLQRASEAAVYGQHSQLRVCRRGAGDPARARHNRAHQSGWWKRQPIRFIGGKDSAELAGYLNGFPNLQQTLSELDYRRFSLTFDIVAAGAAALNPGPPAKWSVKCRRCAVICGWKRSSGCCCSACWRWLIRQ